MKIKMKKNLNFNLYSVIKNYKLNVKNKKTMKSKIQSGFGFLVFGLLTAATFIIGEVSMIDFILVHCGKVNPIFPMHIEALVFILGFALSFFFGTYARYYFKELIEIEI